jgi:hypothetical protein
MPGAIRLCGLLFFILGLINLQYAACFVQHGFQAFLRAAPARAPVAAVGFLRQPMTKRRALPLRMADSGNQGGSAGDGKVPFRKDDAELMREMAKAEAEAGNSTGAENLNTIADRMQTIMDRSSAKLAKKLDVDDVTEKGGETGQEKRWWPFLDTRLVAQGKSVWVSSIKEGPKSARGAKSFEAGSFVTWKFKVNQLTGPMCIGLTSLSVDLDKAWSLDEYFNEALYITQNGNLYNGGQLIWESGNSVKSGDVIEVTLDGDMVYVAVNDEPLPATLGPITTTSLRPTVQLQMLDDGISLLEEDERVKPSVDQVMYEGLCYLSNLLRVASTC